MFHGHGVISVLLVIYFKWVFWYLDYILVNKIFQNSSSFIHSIEIGYTRIFDFHHHWHDVFVGGLVGSLVAFATFKFILNWRHYNPRFLPYTVASDRPKSGTITQNGGAPLNYPHRISPNTGYDQEDRF
jgi:membrane-associated phospholipid phosphatase